MVIGVTGGVGSGKSTVLDYLKKQYHAAVIPADDVAKDLMMPGEASYEAVLEYFGTSILTGAANSEIDRGKLADIVFHDGKKLEVLNSLTHPLVRKKILHLIDEYLLAGYRMIAVEAALFIQAGYMEIVDELWVVYTDYDVRVQRLKESRGYSQEKTDSIISNQLEDAVMISYADFIINNSGSSEETEAQIDQYINERNKN